MPDEPNSNVEEQLKAWARKRREEAGEPLELHPATRNLLQAEVARTFRKDAAEPSASEPSAQPGGWWKMFWPRFALAGAIGTVLVIVFGLSGPTLFKAKFKTQRIAAINRLSQIGLAARIYAADHDGKLPSSFQQMRDELGGASADSLVKDPESGKDFVYLGSGDNTLKPDSLLAYSPIEHRGSRAVLLADGTVRQMDEAQFNESLRRSAQGETEVALTTPPVPALSLADNKRKEEIRGESKDARRLPAEQPVKAENRQSLERSVQLAHADKESKSTPAQTQSSVNEAATTDDARRKLMMQRYGLVQERTKAGATVATADKQTLAALPQTPPAAVPLSASRRVDAGQGVAGGTARNAAVGSDLAFNKPQGVVPTDASSGAQAERATTGKFVALAEQREADRAGASNAFGYGPAAAAPQVGQRFAQVQQYRVNFNSPPMPNVLRSFEVEQNGWQIRVVDADGSIYDGVIEKPVNTELAKRGIAVQTLAAGPTRTDAVEAKSAEPVSLAADGAIAPQNVSFQVAGTNRTLNQRVVFNGNLLANTNGANAILLGEQVKAGRTGSALQQTRSPQNQQLPTVMIQGQATIDGSNRIEINAVPVGP